VRGRDPIGIAEPDSRLSRPGSRVRSTICAWGEDAPGRSGGCRMARSSGQGIARRAAERASSVASQRLSAAEPMHHIIQRSKGRAATPYRHMVCTRADHVAHSREVRARDPWALHPLGHDRSGTPPGARPYSANGSEAPKRASSGRRAKGGPMNCTAICSSHGGAELPARDSAAGLALCRCV
jgi:hypothetical protein